MLHYARADTHYLLYIYHQLRQALSDPSLHVETDAGSTFAEVMRRSSATALRTYIRPRYEGGHALLEKWRKVDEWPTKSTAYAVFSVLHDWRDRLARELDESPFYVLSNAALLALTQAFPRTPIEVAKHTTKHPLVRARASEIAALVEDALDRTANLVEQTAAPTPSVSFSGAPRMCALFRTRGSI